MGFRNPVRSLPATRITGQLSGTQLKADAIDGKTITGATVQTAKTGRRIMLAPDGNTYWYTGATGEFAPGRIQSEGGSTPSLSLFGPRMDDIEDYGFKVRQVGAGTSALINTDTTTIVGDATVAGEFAAGNMAWGSANITPVANTNTSLTVSGVGLIDAGSYRVFLTAFSGLPSVLKPPTANNASADGFTLWVNRADSNPMTIWWLMLAK